MKRFIALVLAVCMAISVMPVTARASQVPAAVNATGIQAGGSVELTLDAGESTILSFTPKESGSYAFYMPGGEFKMEYVDGMAYGYQESFFLEIRNQGRKISHEMANMLEYSTAVADLDAGTTYQLYAENYTMGTQLTCAVYVDKLEDPTSIRLWTEAPAVQVGNYTSILCGPAEGLPFINVPINWEIENESILSLDYVWPNSITVAALAEGTSKITATLENGAKATCTLYVTSDGTVPEDPSSTCGENLTWTLDGEGTLTISGQGSMKDYLPYDPGMGFSTPWDAENVKKVVIEEGVTSIGFYAFHGHKALETVQLPETLIDIYPQAFADSGVREINLPEGLLSLGYAAFNNCDNLLSIRIPDQVNWLSVHMFCGCDNLKTVTLGANVGGFSDCVFADCNSLETMTFTGNVPNFKEIEFYGLEFTAYYPADNETWTADKLQGYGGNITWLPIVKEIATGWSGYTQWILTSDGKLTVYGEGNMKNYGYEGGQPWLGKGVDITSVVIEEGVTRIGSYAFRGTKIKTLTVPETVTVIGAEAFSKCTTLEELRFTGDVPSIAENAFTDLWLTAYYPYRNDTWTEDKLLPYGGHLTWEPYCPDGGYPCDDGHHVPARDNSGDESGFCKWCGIPCRSSGSTVWAIEEDGTMYVYGSGEMYAHDSNWKKYADQVTALVVKEGVTGTIHGFDQFRNLESVSLPEGLACIEKGCFAGCTSLKQVNFPESLTEMGSNAFQNCVSLEEVRLPAGLKSFGARPFGGCTSLTGIWVDEANPWFTNDSKGVLFSKDMTVLEEAPGTLSGHYTIPETVNYIEWAAFDGCAGLTGVDIPNGVTMLEMNLFENCTSLKSITIPASVRDVWIQVFMGCTGLETVIFEGDAPRLDNAFDGLTFTAYYPAGNKTWTEEVMASASGNITWIPKVETVATGWSGATQWTLTSDGVLTVYGSGKMKNYGYVGGQPWLNKGVDITAVVIQAGVTAVGTGAFRNLTTLESVTLPETGLKTIGEAAFYGCTSLKEITVPESIYTIWAYTFKGCTALEKVKLPKGLVKIDQGAFENCTALPYVFLPGNLEVLGEWSFKGCTGLAEVDMQWINATGIRQGTFKNCSSLTTVHFPEGITTFGDSAFYGIGAETFIVPETVTAIAGWCFARANLKSITFLGDAPTIGEGAFNKVTMTAYYPTGNATWTTAVMQNYGGTVEWKCA